MASFLNRHKRPKAFRQLDSMDCAPTCLLIVCAYYGAEYDLQALRTLTGIGRNGVSVYNLKKAAEAIGFYSIAIKSNIDTISADVNLPCILHWDDNHYVVLYKIRNDVFYIIDPAVGYVMYNKNQFKEFWQKSSETGVVLLLESGVDFPKKNLATNKALSPFKTIHKYVSHFKRFFLQLVIGLTATTALQLAFPFLTQNLVDKGIGNKNFNFVLLIIIGQTVLIASRMLVDFLRSWILLHISMRVNLSLISKFLIKLMKLPLSFFDTKNIGDVFQRINDHKRIEQFLTVSTLNTIFSLVTYLTFSVALLFYSRAIFILFFIASVLYFSWSVLFLKRRKELDYKRFNASAKNQNILLQIIEGMQDIKLNGSDEKNRIDWENIQADLFRVQTKSLFLRQYQESGAFLINELRNIVIVCLSAYSVIKGEMTIGVMMAIQYIVGQLSSPVDQFVSVIQTAQEAKISLDRINEIHSFEDEMNPNIIYKSDFAPDEIRISNMSFCYPGQVKPVLKNINLTIPFGKTTAIVGSSGSGKTTLLKILLKFYTPQAGAITLGNVPFETLDIHKWRNKCGAVMQDGYIFSDTIAKNIAPEALEVDYKRVKHAVDIANLGSFLNDLSSGLETRIGVEGVGLSQGQKQRILIARSIYKDPHYLFFDEATNALDAKNEKLILEKLQDFFENKTVVVVAHRLSTVKNADKIVVLDNGEIAEEGTHFELIELKGKYYELVKNQLELAEA